MVAAMVVLSAVANFTQVAGPAFDDQESESGGIAE